MGLITICSDLCLGSMWVWTSPLPPRPFTPAGVKGSLNSRFGFCAPNTELLARDCGTFVVACVGKRSGRSQRQQRWRTADSFRSSTHAPSASEATRDISSTAHDVSAANEHAVSGLPAPTPLGRAEQRRDGRTRAGACLSEASLRTTPHNPSSARYPEGARHTARLSFAYFSLAKQRKVRRLPGRNPASHNSNKAT